MLNLKPLIKRFLKGEFESIKHFPILGIGIDIYNKQEWNPNLSAFSKWLIEEKNHKKEEIKIELFYLCNVW
jgi:hypothetical protein